jgi:hypothetical protein
MINMKRAVVFVVMGGLSLTGAAMLGCFSHNPASAAELNGFAINTQDKDKAVTITLFTDHRVPYATEHQGKQFSIVLPNTQISPEQLNNGLPVVVDNKNKFIGRAVPTEDGKVRIILPNLPASEYAVSIQQKYAATKAPVGDSATKPRSATSLGNGNIFEQVVASLPKAQSAPRLATRTSTNDGATRHTNSATPHRLIERGPNTKNMIWNPYATRPPATKTVAAHEETDTDKPESSTTALHLSHLPSAAVVPEQAQPFPQAAFGGAARDPLWNLHSLPPASPNGLPTTDLKALAAQDAKLEAASKAAIAVQTKAPTATAAPTSYTRGLLKELQASFKSIPQWLLITLAVFMGGVGVFTLIGGLVLLKILFVQARTQVFTQLPLLQEPLAPGTGTPDKGQYASHPGQEHHNRYGFERYDFEDKSSVSALDYLKGSPDSVTTAVHNATLLKFSTNRRHRNGLKKATAAYKSGTSSYKISP